MPVFQPFQRVTSIDAVRGDEWNRMATEVERLSRIRPGGVLSMQDDAGGPRIYLDPSLIPSFLTVKESDGIPSVEKVHTIEFNQSDGFSLVSTVAGAVRVDYDFPGIAVREIDGSPSLTGINTLVTDQSTGLAVAAGGAGEANLSVRAASASQMGAVTTTAQTMVGAKSFTNRVTIGTITNPKTWETDEELIVYGDIRVTHSGTINFGTGTSTEPTDFLASIGASASNGLSFGSTDLPGGSATATIAMALNHVNMRLEISSPVGGPAKFHCEGSDGVSTTATAPSSITITGGIVTSVTNGTAYTAEIGQDDIGGILGNTTTITLTYNDGVPSITASVNAGSIGTTELASGSVTADIIADGAVGAAEIAGNAVGLDELAPAQKIQTWMWVY